jgi:hypothetical protein
MQGQGPNQGKVRQGIPAKHSARQGDAQQEARPGEGGCR